MKKIECEICKKEFKTTQGLGGHKLRSHLNKDKQKYYAKQGNIKAKELYPMGTFYGKKHTKETRDKISESRCESLNENAFYSKRFEYRGVKLDSSYELLLAKSLDEYNIFWIRPKHLKWNDDGIIRRYIPDFYLPEYNIYLDPKNDYLIKKDQRKIKLAEEYNKVKILILNKNQLDWKEIIKLLP